MIKRKLNGLSTLILLTFVYSTVCNANNGEWSGGSKTYVRRTSLEMTTRSTFDSFVEMHPNDIFNSSLFDKELHNLHLPGTSSWFRPTSLCSTDHFIQTVNPVRVACEEWTVRLRESEYGRRERTFTRYIDARDKAEGRNGVGRPECTKPIMAYYEIAHSQFTSTFFVDFFDRRSGEYLGEIEYGFRSCNSIPSRNATGYLRLSGGEWSGGSIYRL